MSEEPPAKRFQPDPSLLTDTISEPSTSGLQNAPLALGDRLIVLYNCIFCYRLPLPDLVHHCPKGHVVCESCLVRHVARAVLSNSFAECSVCRVGITWANSRCNLVVKQAISELTNNCKYCHRGIINRFMKEHETTECLQRPTICTYELIGCPWHGGLDELAAHEEVCLYAHKTAEDVLREKDVDSRYNRSQVGRVVMDSIKEYLSIDRLMFIDLQLNPATGVNVRKDVCALFETPFFTAYNEQWFVMAFMEAKELNVFERKLSYKLVLKDKQTAENRKIGFIAMQSFTKYMSCQQLCKHVYSEGILESEYNTLILLDNDSCNRTLAEKGLFIRLWMCVWPQHAPMSL